MEDYFRPLPMVGRFLKRSWEELEAIWPDTEGVTITRSLTYIDDDPNKTPQYHLIYRRNVDEKCF